MIIIYARRSVEDSNSLSIQTQIEQCKQRINNSSNNIEHIEVIIDNGVSGASPINKRPGGSKMLQLINNNQVSAIYVAKQDRLCRNARDFLGFISILNDKNIRLVILDNNIDVSSMSGKFVSSIMASLAEMERDMIKSRAIDSTIARTQLGVFTGGTIPFAMDLKEILLDGRHFHILSPNENKFIVEEIFDLYTNQYYSMLQIEKLLDSKYKDSKLNVYSINRILRNPLYCSANVDVYYYYKSKGIEVFNPIKQFTGQFSARLMGKKANNKTLYLTRTEPIIDADTFVKAQIRLDKNKTNRRLGTGTKINTFLNSLLYCHCGHPLELYNNNGYLDYARCKYKYNSHKCSGVGATVRLKEVEEAIIPILKKKVQELRDVNIVENSTNDVKINNLKLQISTIEKDIQIYTEKILMANEATMSIINSKIEALTQEKHSLELKISKLLASSKVNTCKPSDEVIEKVQGFEKLSIQDQRFVARTLIDKIELGSENNELVAKIQFKF